MQRSRLSLSRFAAGVALALAAAAIAPLAQAQGYPVVVPASSKDSGSRSVVAIDQGGIANQISYATSLANNAQNSANNAQNTANYAVAVGSNAQNTANYGVALANAAQGTANSAAAAASGGKVVGTYSIGYGSGIGSQGLCISGFVGYTFGIYGSQARTQCSVSYPGSAPYEIIGFVQDTGGGDSSGSGGGSAN